MKPTSFLLLGILILACAKNSPNPVSNTQPNSEGVYTLSFPLAVGKSWVYETIWKLDTLTVDSSRCSISVTAQTSAADGTPVYEFHDTAANLSSYDYYDKKADGLYLYAGTPGGSLSLFKMDLQPGVVTKNPPILLVPFTFKANDCWSYDTIIDTATSIVTVLKRTFDGIEQVSTPSGARDCFKFETVGYLNEKRYHYFANGIGLVKREEILDSFPLSRIDANGVVVTGYARSDRAVTLISSN